MTGDTKQCLVRAITLGVYATHSWNDQDSNLDTPHHCGGIMEVLYPLSYRPVFSCQGKLNILIRETTLGALDSKALLTGRMYAPERGQRTRLAAPKVVAAP